MRIRTARAGTLLRLAAGGALGWTVAASVLSPHTGLFADVATLIVIGLTWWRPIAGLIAVIALAPAGLLVAAAPARAAELLTWAFLAAWLLSVWRPIATATVPRRVVIPAVLYGACAFASWFGLTIEGAGGVEVGALPLFLVRSLVRGHVLFSAAESETWTWLQAAAGLAMFLAAMAVTGRDSRACRAVAYTVIGSATALALGTMISVAEQWRANEFGGWFLLRYVRGERFALHLADLNAAGSVYTLAILITLALAVVEGGRRWIYAASAAVMLPALWLTGSRAAALAVVLVFVALVPMVHYRIVPRVTRQAAVVLVVLVVGVGGAVIAMAQQPADEGSAARSMRLRSQFLVTSARMLASAPVFGVGIGRYHERSHEFMPSELRAVYPYENAHNYFAQQFAELGVVGGVLFVWLVIAALAQGWSALRSQPAEPVLLALLAGTVGYLLTCATGHPLLVSEAALPFWATFGTVAASGSHSHVASGSSRKIRFAIAAVVATVLAVGVAMHARHYVRPAAPPPERGFYALETGEDGRPFVWMTRRGVWNIGPQPGFLRIPVRAPDQPVRPHPFVVDVELGGRRVASREVPPGRWTTITIPIREHAKRPFRRVDLWANQVWSRKRDLGARDDDEPRSVMVGEVRWEPAGSR